MNSHNYTYTLLRDDIVKSIKSKNNAKLGEMGADTTKDSAADTLSSLFFDIKRRVNINGEMKVEDTLFESLDNIESPENVAKFIQWLKEKNGFSDEEIKKLKDHYSQGPMMRIAAITGDFSDNNSLILKPEHDINLFREDGQIFLKVTAKNFKIYDREMPGTPEATLKGPIEIIYLLTDQGFEMHKVSTESKMLHDMFLGISPTKQEVLNDVNTLNLTPLNNIEDELKSHLDTFPNEGMNEQQQLEKQAVQNIIRALERYKNTTIDLVDLKAAIQGSKELITPSNPPSASRFSFRRKEKTTLSVIDDISKSLEPADPKKKQFMLFKK